MRPMKFPYTRGGQPLLQWKHGPPYQSRAADSVALGSTLSEPTFSMPLPQPGAPEPLGCGCAGGRDVIDIDLTPVASIAFWYLLFRYLSNRT